MLLLRVDFPQLLVGSLRCEEEQDLGARDEEGAAHLL